MQGLYLAPPHGELIATGRKVAIAKARPMGLEGEWVLLSGGHAYGLMRVGTPEQVDLPTFQDRKGEHGVSEKERKRWWPEQSPLYLYPVEGFVPYVGGPVEVTLPPGVQTRVDVEGMGLPILQKEVKTVPGGRLQTLQDGRQVVIAKLPGRKSLTAIVLSVEDTPDGPVAIYGLPITDLGEGKKTKVTGPRSGGRWRTLKTGKRVYIAAPERARNPGHAGRWSQDFAPTKEERMALLEDDFEGDYWSTFFETEAILSDPDIVEFGELDWEDQDVTHLVNDYANEEWGEWLGSLSQSERNALKDYTTEGYTPINSLLRKGEAEEFHSDYLGFHFGEKEAREAVEQMDSALVRSPLPADMVVFRGKVEKPGRISLSIGDEFTDKGFVSTSLNPQMSEELFAQDYSGKGVSLLTAIRVPKGTPAGYLSTWRRSDGTGHDAIGKTHEAELLLARNLRFRVVDLQGSLSEPGEARLVLEVIE